MSWKPLPISACAGAQLPPVLISTAFKEDAYTLHLTDLTSIWSESLDRQTIIQRSREENTSIDPSSSGQFQIFLDKIKLGLEGGDGSVLTVGDANEGEGRRPGLVLGVTVKLPGGLVPLQWPFRLFAAPQSLLTSQLVLPLLKAQHMRAKELEGLQEILRQKDHVIEKLVENFKGDLSEVFPHGRTKKKGEWQGEKVKGMPKFVYEKWRTTLETSSDITTETLIEETFGSAVLPAIGPVDTLKDDNDEDEEGEWWENMHGMSVNLKTGKMTTGGMGNKGKAVAQSSSPVKSVLKTEVTISKPKADDSTEDEDDDFQVQSNPAPAVATEDTNDDFDAPSQHKIPDSFPRSPSPAAANNPKKKLGAIGGRKAGVKPQPEDESTADENENEDEEPDAPPPLPTVESKPKKKLGAIGGKKAVAIPPPDDESTADEEDIKQASPPPAKSETKPKKQPPSPSPKPEAKLAKAGSDTESDPEPEKPSSTTVPEDATPEPPEPAKPKRKLGQIGGKKQTADVTPTLEVKPEPTSSAPSPKKKLGIIGGKREVALPAPSESGRGRPSGVKAERTPTPEPPKRETSQERAHHKREALKRELEQKAKAPVKKKRKF